jgi:Ca2+-binding RTX toxin-like protein
MRVACFGVLRLSASSIVEAQMGRVTFKQNIIKGTAKDDTLEGGPGADRLVGSSGNDRLIAHSDDYASAPSGVLIYDGGPGKDTLDFSQSDRAVGVDLYIGSAIYRDVVASSDGNFTYYATGSRLVDAISGIENLTGSNFADFLHGDDGNNIIRGGGGDDRLQAGRGTDTLVGGDGNDFLYFGSAFGSITGDDDTNPAATGNDVFHVGGNDAGIYSIYRITDFDVRTDATDTSFDKVYFSSYQELTWGQSASGELVAFRWAQGQKIGEVIFSGLTLADAGLVPVYEVDYSTPLPVVAPYSPDLMF